MMTSGSDGDGGDLRGSQGSVLSSMAKAHLGRGTPSSRVNKSPE